MSLLPSQLPPKKIWKEQVQVILHKFTIPIKSFQFFLEQNKYSRKKSELLYCVLFTWREISEVTMKYLLLTFITIFFFRWEKWGSMRLSLRGSIWLSFSDYFQILYIFPLHHSCILFVIIILIKHNVVSSFYTCSMNSITYNSYTSKTHCHVSQMIQLILGNCALLYFPSQNVSGWHFELHLNSLALKITDSWENKSFPLS